MSSNALEKYSGGLRPTILTEVKLRLREMHFLVGHNNAFNDEYELLCGEIIDLVSERVSDEANKAGYNSAINDAANFMDDFPCDAEEIRRQFLNT